MKEADIRFPLTVSKDWVLPRDEYLADLKPVEMENVKFDPEKKTVSKLDANKKGSARVVLAVKPHHRWLIYSHRGGGSEVFADGKKIYQAFPYSRQTAKARVRIPKGTKQLEIQIRSYLAVPGFTEGPRVAKAQVCLPGMNPADYLPVVFTTTGQQVACRIIRAADGGPLTAIFDSSSGETDYFFYPVHKRHKVSPLPWKPPAGLILETRYFDEYDSTVETFEGFNTLWDRSTFHAGRKLVDSPHITRFPPFPPFDTRPFAPDAAPLALSRLQGVFHVANSGKARFYARYRNGGYLLIDGKLFIRAGGHENREDEPDGHIKPAEGGKEIELSRGLHTYELCLYGAAGNHYGGLSFFGTPFGTRPSFPQPADTNVKPAEHRNPNTPLLTVFWSDVFEGTNVVQALGQWPAGDMASWPFSAGITGAPGDVVFRWGLPCGREAEGSSVGHTFFERGVYPVVVEALRAGDRSVVARTDVRAKVGFHRPRGHRGYGRFNDELMSRTGEFDKDMPIEHLLSIHAWAVQNHRRPMKGLTSAAIVKRIDEVLKERGKDLGYLLWLAKELAVPPASAHDSAYKLFDLVYRALEPGTGKRRETALAMCEILTDVYDKPAEALRLIETAGAKEDPLVMDQGWELAEDSAFYADLRKINPAKAIAELQWEEATPEGTCPFQQWFAGSMLWMRKRLDLVDRDNTRPLYLNVGMLSSEGMIYMNNRPVCEPWQCKGEILFVPPEMLRDGPNELAIHFGPRNPDYKGNYLVRLGPHLPPLDREFRLARARALLAQDKLDEAGGLLKQEALTLEVAANQPPIHLADWYVLGPAPSNKFWNEERGSLVPARDVDLDAPINGMKWRKLEEEFYRGVFVDLQTLVPVGQHLWLYKSFDAEQPFDSKMETLGGNKMRVRLNGELVMGNIGRRGRMVGQTIRPVPKGRSEILVQVEVTNSQHVHNFRFSMTNPNSEQSEMSEASMMRKAKLWANDGEPDHADASRDFLESILNRQPEKRLNLDIMTTMVRALIGQEAYRRALVLSARLLRCTPPEKYERTLLLSQVQARLGLRELDEAREIFIKRLNKDFPYSEETLKAREAIIQWVMGERRKEAEKNY